MDPTLTNYFNVRKQGSRVSQKRINTCDDDIDAGRKLQKPRPTIPSSVVSIPAKTITFPEIPPECRKLRSTVNISRRTSNVLSKAKATQKKLPAYRRLAHLVKDGKKLLDVPCNLSNTNDSLSVAKVIGAYPTTELNAHIVKIEVVEPIRKATPNIPCTPSKELRALTQSDSLPCTPVKGSIIPVDKKIHSERVIPDVVPDSPIPAVLHLPYHMERLLELFRTCETIVSTLHNRAEVCSFDKISPAVQEVVRSDFTEETVGKIAALYPEAYSFRYDKQLDKITKLQLTSYTLVFVPNLRTDGTQMAYDSPSKGHLVFTGSRLIQRRHRFHKALLSRVKKAHRAFLVTRFAVSEAELPADSALRRWHPAFPLDTAVPEVTPASLPPRPDAGEKITSAREAVTAFRARALFKEAALFEKLPSAISDVAGASAISKTMDTTQQPLKPTSTVAHLRGVSASLLAKVREREKQMQFSLLTTVPLTPSDQQAYSALPTTITLVWRELRGARPVPLATVVARLSRSSESGLSIDEATRRLEMLLDLMPDWIERVIWARPHLRLKDGAADRPLKDVIEETKVKVTATKGFKF